MLSLFTVVQLLTGVVMKTIHGMFAAKPKPTSLPVELNVQIIAVSVHCMTVCLLMFPVVNGILSLSQMETTF